MPFPAPPVEIPIRTLPYRSSIVHWAHRGRGLRMSANWTMRKAGQSIRQRSQNIIVSRELHARKIETRIRTELGRRRGIKMISPILPLQPVPDLLHCLGRHLGIFVRALVRLQRGLRIHVEDGMILMMMMMLLLMMLWRWINDRVLEMCLTTCIHESYSSKGDTGISPSVTPPMYLHDDIRLILFVRIFWRMLCRTPLLPPRRYGRDVRLEALLFRAVRARRQLDQRVQRNLHPGALLLGHVVEVGVNAPKHRLVRHDDHVLAALQLHDNRLQPDDHVPVRLAAAVSVIVLVLVPCRKVLWVSFLNFFVRESIADAAVELVECLPFELLEACFGSQVSCSLDCALEGRCPDYEFAALWNTGLF